MNTKAANGDSPQICMQNIGDTEISCLQYAGDGPPLIFLHATGFLPWLWHPLARELAGDYRIFAPYFSEYRDTDPENGGFHWRALAEDLSIVCERLHLERPFLVGHSMGATVAVIANALYGIPAAGMVLIEPILFPPELYKFQISVEQYPRAAKAIQRTNFWRDRDEAMTYLRSRSLFQGWDEEILELYFRHGMSGEDGGLRLTCSPRHEAALFMGGVKYDPWPLLSRVSCPVLTLEGEKSENRGFIDLDRVRTLIPDCTYHLVSGAGHLIPMEQPREVTRLIGDFFRPLRPAGKKKEQRHVMKGNQRKEKFRKRTTPGCKAEPFTGRSAMDDHSGESHDFARRRARSGRGPVRRNLILEKEEARMATATKVPVKPAKAPAKTKTPVKAPAKAPAKALAKPKAPVKAVAKASAKSAKAKAKAPVKAPAKAKTVAKAKPAAKKPAKAKK